MEVLKTDQKILSKYLNGATVRTIHRTPLKQVRGYSTSDDRAIFISTKTCKEKVAQLVSLIAAQKNWNLSINTEGSYLVCLLCP